MAYITFYNWHSYSGKKLLKILKIEKWHFEPSKDLRNLTDIVNKSLRVKDL